jgi:hypothetical protein
MVGAATMGKFQMKTVLTAIVSLALSGCADGYAYTLYRNSAIDQNMRVHIATFDATEGFSASEGNDYNSQNCEIAAKLFKAQPGVTVRYWCEKGNFKK